VLATCGDLHYECPLFDQMPLRNVLCAFLVWHGNCSKAREIMEELGKKMKIEMDNKSNYGHLERPNLSKALEEA
jgi:hypothetical protein